MNEQTMSDLRVWVVVGLVSPSESPEQWPVAGKLPKTTWGSFWPKFYNFIAKNKIFYIKPMPNPILGVQVIYFEA